MLRTTDNTDTWTGILPLNVPQEIKTGPYRAFNVIAGAYRNARVVVGQIESDVNASNSYRLTKNGMVVLREFERAWIVNTEGVADNLVPLVVQFHKGAVGLAKVELDRQTTLTFHELGQIAVNQGAKVALAQSFADFAVNDDATVDTQQRYWNGWVSSDKAFRLKWSIVAELSPFLEVIVGGCTAKLNAENSRWEVNIETVGWDFLWDGATVPAVPVVHPGRLPLTACQRNLIRCENIGTTGVADVHFSLATTST